MKGFRRREKLLLDQNDKHEYGLHYRMLKFYFKCNQHDLILSLI